MTETTKRKLLWPIIIASCLPLLGILHLPTTFTLKSAALYLSALAGYVGVMMLLWMFVLGAKSAMGMVFKDLAPVLSVHKKLGRYGSIAFLLHPLLVVYSYGESLLYSVIPHIDTQFERWVTLGRASFMLLAMIWVTSILLRDKLGFRPWKYLHYFAYISLPFALLHVPGIGSQYLAAPLVRAYYFAIVAVFGVFLLVRLSSWLNLDRRSYRITTHQQLTPEDYAITITPVGKPMRLHRGQYVYLKVGYISEDHPFSVTYIDDETGEMTLTYRVYGGFTRYLTGLRPGAVVSLAGPYGSFMHGPTPSRPVVYIAGGIGITPFVQPIIDGAAGQPWLFVANRTHASAVLVRDIKKRLGDRCVAIYSREPARTGEEQGHISEDLLGKYLPDPAAHQYFICGSKSFTREARRILAAIGVPAHQVEWEKFSW